MRLKTFLFAALAAGCASDTDSPLPPETELEGTTGKVAVEFPWGTQMEAYEIIDGFVVIRGDIIVKRADQLHERSTTRIGGRWGNNEVRYAFATNTDAQPAQAPNDQAKDRMRQAVTELEAEIPINFIEIANPCTYPNDNCATDYILLRRWDNTGGQSARPNGNGYVGHLGGQQIINAQDGFSVGGYKHEIFHALGMYHEQERNDRDDYVTFRAECTVDGKEGNFTKNGNPDVDFGTYDFTSIMQYNSGSFALTPVEQAAAPCNGHWPLERWNGSCPANICVDADGNGSREFINGSGTPSANDIDALWAMYAPALAANEAGDYFGNAIAHGDFDADGRDDLAIGAPYEDTANNTAASAGAVFLFKGTADGFQPWKLVTQASLGALEESGDNFGMSLAVGDFDDNGIADLAIGAPGESVGNNPDAGAGAVYLMRGSASGLADWKAVTQADVGANVEGGDRFGHALVAADFTGDGRDDLAIGSPGETHGDGIKAGHVYVMRGTGSSTALASWSDVGQDTLNTAPNSNGGGIALPPVPLGTNQANDNFGASLAAGRIDEDGIADLVVGAHCDYDVAACAGGAYLYRGAAAAMRGWMRVAQSSGADAFDRFGWSVAVGDIDMDGDDDVLVGAPNDDYSGGTDVGRVYVARADGHIVAATAVLSQSGTGSDAGDHDYFGSSIAIGTNGAFDIIAIGAREEVWGNNAAAVGAVFIFNASDSGNISYQQTLRASPASDEVAEDAFGTTVATFVDGGRDYVIVGNPPEDAAAGNVQIFSATVGADLGQAQLLTQATKGTRAP